MNEWVDAIYNGEFLGEGSLWSGQIWGTEKQGEEQATYISSHHFEFFLLNILAHFHNSPCLRTVYLSNIFSSAFAFAFQPN